MSWEAGGQGGAHWEGNRASGRDRELSLEVICPQVYLIPSWEGLMEGLSRLLVAAPLQATCLPEVLPSCLPGLSSHCLPQGGISISSDPQEMSESRDWGRHDPVPAQVQE